jgi:hypothetical protein
MTSSNRRKTHALPARSVIDAHSSHARRRPLALAHQRRRFPVDNPGLYRRMLRIARFIEYGGPMNKEEMRETLVECKKRPKGKPCPGLMWVIKTSDDAILATCIACKTEEVLIHNWHETEWADGMMEPVPANPDLSAAH